MKRIIVVLIALLILPRISLAAKGGNKPPQEGNNPIIEKVVTDFGTSEILIFGQYLRGTTDPEISLAGLPVDLSVNDTSSTEEVIAVLPDWYEDAGYL